jgi:basic membrane protein A
MREKVFVLAALAMAFALIASACGGDEGCSEDQFCACEASDTGGIDDRAFNALAWEGLEQFKEAHGDAVGIDFVESATAADYEPNLRAMLDKGCAVTILPGYLWIETILEFAPAHPEAMYGIVDVGGLSIPNVREITFQTDEASFLAGYLAAAVSQTGKVGTYGGIQIPTVTIFMDGFAEGVEYYNAQKGTNVQVLGWDIATQTGLFTEDFEAVDKGQQITQTLLDEGADIILPVGGKIGLGACAAIKAAGGAEAGLYHIGVDKDWNISAEAECGDFTITSVLKMIDTAVLDTANGVLANGTLPPAYLGTLKNGGVGISRSGVWEDAVSAELAGEIDALQAAIIAAETTPGDGLVNFLGG